MLLVPVLEAVGIACFLVGLSFLALHLLFVDGPSLQLLRSPLLRRPQPLQAGHLVQLLKLLDQLQVAGHDTGGGGGRTLEEKSVTLAGAATSGVASSHRGHHHSVGSSPKREEKEIRMKTREPAP